MDALLLNAGTVMVAGILAGLARRRRLTRVVSWTAYLVLVLAWQVAIAARPELFRLRYWSPKEAVAGLLTLAIALEIGYKALAALPGARRTAASALAAVLWLSVLFVVTLPASEWAGDWSRYLGLAALPRLNVGIALSYAVVLGTALLYRVPLDLIHRAVLAGLSVYLVVFVMVMDQLNLDWLAQPLNGKLAAIAYTVVLVVWLREAWRREEVFAHLAAPLRRLWPWASPA